MKLTKFWKIFLISLASVLFVGLVGGGVYIYIKDPFGYKVPKLDKYADILDWCDSSDEDGTLNLDCKALLLDITVDESNNSCFDMLVITKDKELKELTVCEPTKSLSYTNEVLGYKKLMPIDMGLTYSKDSILNNYAFSNVSFEPMDEEYIHNIVNEDIANLVQTDVESVTTIKNSVNFCPQPDNLPEYVTLDNQNSYGSFYISKSLNDTFFQDGSLYDLEREELNILFSCDSQVSTGLIDSCERPLINISKSLDDSFMLMPSIVDTDVQLEASDIMILKNISIIYEGDKYITIQNKSDLIQDYVESLKYSSSINANLYCSIYKLLSSLGNQSENLKNYVLYMNNYINSNIENLEPGICEIAINFDSINIKGLYIKNYLKTNQAYGIFSIIDRCINLASILN